jgi:hypothetical protein
MKTEFAFINHPVVEKMNISIMTDHKKRKAIRGSYGMPSLNWQLKCAVHNGLILARLLMPKDFGLIGMLSIFL